MSHSPFRFSRSLLLILVLLVTGGLFAWWMVAQSDHEMRASLLQQAWTVAQSVNRDQVKALTGTAADLDQTDYQRIKEQLTSVRLTIPQCRFLYLLGRRTDGAVFFFVDSESATSKDYSPPGRVYAEVPVGFHCVFDTKVAAVQGPRIDRYGMWVSGAAPLTDPRTGAVLAVLGMDVDARDWKWNLVNRTAQPVGLVLVLFTGGAIFLFATRRPSAPRNLIAALSMLAAGLLVTGMVALYAKANGEMFALRAFESVGNEIRLDILARLHACAQILHSTAALFGASVSVDREKWRTFTQGLQLEQNLPGIQGVGFASLIPRAKLAAHVAEIRREGFSEYQVWPAGDREPYSAIIYLEPFSGRNQRAFGYDMFSEPMRRKAMERARDENSPALSGKVTLVQETDQEVQAGTLMYVPVYQRGLPVETVAQRRAALQGWVYSPYRMADLLRGALLSWEMRVKERQIKLQVYDGDVLSADTLLYDNRSAEDNALAATSGVDRLMPVDFAGQRWTLRFVQPGGLAAMTDYRNAWIALFGGTIINLLLFGLTLSLLGTRANAQRLAERLAQKLRVSEASYRNHFENSASVMLLLDPAEGAIIEANAAAARLYGYSLERLRTMKIGDLNIASAAEVRQAIASVMQEQGRMFQFQHRLADGSIRDVEVSSSRIQFGGRMVLHSIIQDITESKHALNALRESEMRFYNLARQSRVIAWEVDGKGLYTYISGVCEAVLGYRDDEIIGKKHFYDLHPEQGREAFKEDAFKAFELKQEFRSFVNTTQAKDGSLRWFSTNGIPIIDIDGTLRGYCGSNTDITERKQAKDELLESESLMRSITDSAQDAILMMDQHGSIAFWNPAASQMFGYTRDEAIGKNLHRLLAPQRYHEDQDAGYARFQLTGQNDVCGAIRSLEALHKNGQEISVEISISSVRRRGEWCAVGVLRNVTERKRIEAKLIELSQVVEQTPASVVITDLAGNIQYVNAAFVALTGYTVADSLGKTPRIIKSGMTSAKTYAEMWRNLKDGKVWRGEIQNRRKDGSFFWEFAIISPGKDTSDKTVRYVAVKEDITQRKRADDALLEVNRNLEKATAAKSEFLATMSHEIRTPMNGVIGMVELLLKTDLDSRQREFAQDISHSGGALLRVIDDVLDFSKIEAGKLDIVCEEFDVSSVVDGVVETVSYRDPEKKLALSGIIDRNVPLKLQGDPMRLRQILLNLAGNAVKFTAKGEVVVRVWLVKISGDSMRLRFEVTDSGVGLTQEQVGKLFQPFVQADSSTARRYGGTGLGLAISHKLVGLMGGEIGAKSALNLGSTFWFELPLGVPAQPSLPISHPGLVLAHAIVGSGQPLIRESLQEQFSRWGVPCDVAGTADDFSRMLSEMAGEGHAVFALCDEELLVQGGANLRQQLRHLRDKAWCVLLASPATVVSEDKADSGLFKAILVKPVRKSLLFDSLVAAVEDGSPASSGKKASNIVSSLGSGQFSALRILVAEDHKINLKLSLAMLKSLGASADVATNGTEALVAVRRKVYDLILMDCHMPEMDGYQATAAIRQWEDSHPNNQRHRARIVALTANALREERERCLDVGMDDYMSKPFTSTQLRQVLSMATQACTAQGEVSHVDDEFLNATRLNELCADLGAEGIKEIIGAFMRDLPESLTELKRFAQSRNWIEAVRTANSLKGVCASFGLVMLTGQLNAMEQAAADNDAETSQRLQDELEPLAKLSADAFQQWLQTARSNS